MPSGGQEFTEHTPRFPGTSTTVCPNCVPELIHSAKSKLQCAEPSVELQLVGCWSVCVRVFKKKKRRKIQSREDRVLVINEVRGHEHIRSSPSKMVKGYSQVGSSRKGF